MVILNIIFSLFSGILILVAYLSIQPSRWAKLDEIIRDLEVLKKKPIGNQHYALEENIIFFKSLRTIPQYILWGLTRRRRLDPKRLLEIADLPLPKWESELYDDLSRVERKKIPGLTTPLRRLIVEMIMKNPKFTSMDLGCGGMEAERQSVEAIIKVNKKFDIKFVGVDLAEQSWAAINNTFEDLKQVVSLHYVKTFVEIQNIKDKGIKIIFICEDGIDFADKHGNKFDLIFSSRFNHHLNDVDKKKSGKLMKNKSLNYIEYDDYSTPISWLLPITSAWFRPILMNGAILSDIRQPTKKELILQKRVNKDWLTIRFFNPPGSYAKIALKADTDKNRDKS